MVCIFLKKYKRLEYQKFTNSIYIFEITVFSKMSQNVAKMSRLRHFWPTGYINLKFLMSSLWKLTWFLMFRFPKVVLLGIFPPAVAFATLAVWLTTLLIIAATPPMGWTCNSSVEALRRDPGSEIPSTAISQWAKNEIKNSTKESSGEIIKLINRSAEFFF